MWLTDFMVACFLKNKDTDDINSNQSSKLHDRYQKNAAVMLSHNFVQEFCMFVTLEY